MIQQVLKQIDFSLWAEAALVLFFLLFVVIAFRTLRADRRAMQRIAAAALDDTKEFPR